MMQAQGRPAAGGQQPREGMRGIDNATGRPVIVRNGQVVFADQPPPPAFNTVRGAPPGVMSNQLSREDEILQSAADERSRLGTAAQQAGRFEALMEQGQGTGGLLRFDPIRAVAGAIDPQVSEMEQINNALAPLQRQPGSGAMSDRDLAVFQRSVVSAELSPQANRSYIAMTRAAQQRARDYEDFLQSYRSQYGPGSLAEAQRVWRQYSNANPVFTDDGQPRPGGLGWREFFQGQSQPQAQQPRQQSGMMRGPSGRQYTAAQVEAARAIPGGPRGRVGTRTNPRMVSGPEEAARLPSGTWVITPEGELRPRP